MLDKNTAIARVVGWRAGNSEAIICGHEALAQIASQSVLISLTDKPGCGPRSAAPMQIKYAVPCAAKALQKSSTSQNTSVSWSNMVTFHGFVGSAHRSKIFDSEPVDASKLLIGVIVH